jgi:hypothetical protein
MRTSATFQERVVNAISAVVTVMAIVVLAVPASAAEPQGKTKSGSKVDIMLMQPMQPKSGDNAFEVMVKGADGKPINDADVSVLFVMPAMPTMKMAEMRNEVKLKPAGDGKYTGSGNIGMAGKWNTTISVKKDGKPIGQKKLTVTAK